MAVLPGACGTSYGSRPERPTGYARRMGACPTPSGRVPLP